ncbi:MAG TPA: aspartate--tRNA ligase [Thermoleophilia bacterium]|nr:aspartate--tRNA ligase [Thermoleophilia bacterium]
MTYRTHWCGEIGPGSVDQDVRVAGWVHRRRDHGGLIFIDLRDRSGLLQLVFDPQVDAQAHDAAEKLRGEFVVSVAGKVVPRAEDQVNPNLATGAVEVSVSGVQVLAPSETPPFFPDERVDVDETLRLRYRYIDLRRERMQRNLILRDRAVQSARRYLEAGGFLEIETPILTKSTPEGARDFLVPSRLQPGEFYALPQSPQLFKQLLMTAGFERYYQMARAFRDEDLRADRQLEHTQIDLEMAFVGEPEVQDLVEGMMAHVWREALGVKLDLPFPRMTYAEAMLRYGSDKPDVRFGLEIVDVSDLVGGVDFKVFSQAVGGGGAVRGIRVPGASGFSRKDVDDLAGEAAVFGAKGLAPVWVEAEGVRSPIAKFFTEEQMSALLERLEAQPGDLLLFVADRLSVVEPSLGALRLSLASRLGVERQGWEFLWIVDPPMFEQDEREGRAKAVHHPFTRPRLERLEELEEHPFSLGTYAYDLVLNGVELGSGSIRISTPDLQEAVFRVLGLDEEEIQAKFGFLVEAMDYGMPPHGGMALGLDRIVALMAGESSIREVIAFPKTQSGSDPMSGAPSAVAAEQLRELHIRTSK